MSYSSELIAVVGPTGGGKSTSTEKLNPAETFYINVSNKPLPFRGWMSKYKLFSTKTEEGKKVTIILQIIVSKLLPYLITLV